MMLYYICIVEIYTINALAPSIREPRKGPALIGLI